MTFELKGWHVLLMLLTFFGVTIAVNVVFTTYALSTFSGEDVSKPYLRGLEYNKTLTARAEQAKLKWTASIEVVREGVADAVVTVSIAGADGQPVGGLAVTALLKRPTDASLDKTVTLEPLGGGQYRGRVADVAAGQWDVVARAGSDHVPSFEAERRVMLK
jgi:nitrogen fixation protein FixH